MSTRKGRGLFPSSRKKAKNEKRSADTSQSLLGDKDADADANSTNTTSVEEEVRGEQSTRKKRFSFPLSRKKAKSEKHSDTSQSLLGDKEDTNDNSTRIASVEEEARGGQSTRLSRVAKLDTRARRGVSERLPRTAERLTHVDVVAAASSEKPEGKIDVNDKNKTDEKRPEHAGEIQTNANECDKLNKVGQGSESERESIDSAIDDELNKVGEGSESEKESIDSAIDDELNNPSSHEEENGKEGIDSGPRDLSTVDDEKSALEEGKDDNDSFRRRLTEVPDAEVAVNTTDALRDEDVKDSMITLQGVPVSCPGSRTGLTSDDEWDYLKEVKIFLDASDSSFELREEKDQIRSAAGEASPKVQDDNNNCAKVVSSSDGGKEESQVPPGVQVPPQSAPQMSEATPQDPRVPPVSSPPERDGFAAWGLRFSTVPPAVEPFNPILYPILYPTANCGLAAPGGGGVWTHVAQSSGPLRHETVSSAANSTDLAAYLREAYEQNTVPFQGGGESGPCYLDAPSLLKAREYVLRILSVSMQHRIDAAVQHGFECGYVAGEVIPPDSTTPANVSSPAVNNCGSAYSPEHDTETYFVPQPHTATAIQTDVQQEANYSIRQEEHPLQKEPVAAAFSDANYDASCPDQQEFAARAQHDAYFPVSHGLYQGCPEQQGGIEEEYPVVNSAEKSHSVPPPQLATGLLSVGGAQLPAVMGAHPMRPGEWGRDGAYPYPQNAQSHLTENYKHAAGLRRGDQLPAVMGIHRMRPEEWRRVGAYPPYPHAQNASYFTEESMLVAAGQPGGQLALLPLDPRLVQPSNMGGVAAHQNAQCPKSAFTNPPCQWQGIPDCYFSRPLREGELAVTGQPFVGRNEQIGTRPQHFDPPSNNQFSPTNYAGRMMPPLREPGGTQPRTD